MTGGAKTLEGGHALCNVPARACGRTPPRLRFPAMKTLRTIALVATLAAAARAGADASDPKIEFEKYTLPNGLEVILAPDQSVPLVAVNIWYHVGSGDEVPGRTGFAHLFEHMMFQGSKNVGMDNHFKVLRTIGSENINGTTNTDRTNYYEVVPSNQIETAIWLESDRMSHLLDVLDKKELDNQIDVVRNERRQRYDNVPYGKALFALFAALYPEGHPYRYLTIGKHEDLTSASVDDVKAFYRTWYVPANATLAIVGDFDVPATKKLVEKWFASFPTSKKPSVVMIPPPAAFNSQDVTLSDDFAKLRRITFAWHSPASYKDGDAELDIAANALAAEGTGRLYKTLVYDKQLAQSVTASQNGATFSGSFTISVTLRSGADLEAVKKLVVEEVARISHESLGDKEIKRVVTGNEAAVIYRLENLNNRANTLQEYNQFLGDPAKITWDLDRYRNTTADKIRAAVGRYLAPDRVVTILTNPTVAAGGAK
ncbi:MAG: peptidase [Myxococcales bacterium]|nr:peptidase [Myxococcales bacterium]